MSRPILLLTCRDPRTDFRRPLAEAFSSLGHEVFYLWLKRRPILTHLASGESRELSRWQTLGFALSLRRKRDLLVFNSTNLAFPMVSLLFRLLAGGQWSFDLHDDLLYETTGWRRLRASLAQFMVVKSADFTVHAASAVQVLFPHSHHLGNASAILPARCKPPDFSRILILASLDERFDFTLLSNLAQQHPHLDFDIWGAVSQNAPAIRNRLTLMLANASNIQHFGAYDSASMPATLARYGVMFAPYVVPSPLTDTIDPLRFYHALNAGLEVISTPIPRAQELANYLHLLGPDTDFAVIIDDLTQGIGLRNPGTTSDQFNWTAKARRLLDIAEAAR